MTELSDGLILILIKANVNEIIDNNSLKPILAKFQKFEKIV